jgi:hypothetical protein
MARSKSQPRRSRKAAAEATLARALAPEDVRPGDYVAVLDEVVEFPSWYWCDEPVLTGREEVVRVRYTPRDDALPMKVRAVCLPFVLVREPCGRERTLDVRRCRLARLHSDFAEASWKCHRKAAKKRRSERTGNADKA